MKLFGFSFLDKIKPLLEKGEKYLEQGKIDLAEIQFKEALTVDPKCKVAREKLKQIYRERDTMRAVYAVTEKAAQAEKKSQESLEATQEEAATGKDRRQHERVSDKRPVHFRVIRKGEQDSGENMNISAGGMYLVVAEKVSLNAFLECKFELPPPLRPIYAIGRVVRVEQIEKEGRQLFGLGIKFTNISPEDQQRIQEYVAKEEK